MSMLHTSFASSNQGPIRQKPEMPARVNLRSSFHESMVSPVCKFTTILERTYCPVHVTVGARQMVWRHAVARADLFHRPYDGSDVFPELLHLVGREAGLELV